MQFAILGANGLVGSTLHDLIAEKKPLRFDSRKTPTFEGVDVAFFCASSAVSKALIPKARAQGTVCIDASGAFRQDSDVPLVIPEINGHLLSSHTGIIASPNCTTTLMLLPLSPIHKAFSITRIVASTYQAVSGAGRRGVEALEAESRGGASGRSFPHPCAFNVFPHESPKGSSGYVEEEEKMERETQKILADPTIGVTARCIRVPVYRAHAISLNVELKQPFELHELEAILRKAPGVRYRDGFSALDTAHQNLVFCGDLRRDRTRENALELWVCGDQLLKGAALNLFHIAEILCN